MLLPSWHPLLKTQGRQAQQTPNPGGAHSKRSLDPRYHGVTFPALEETGSVPSSISSSVVRQAGSRLLAVCLVPLACAWIEGSVGALMLRAGYSRRATVVPSSETQAIGALGAMKTEQSPILL